MTARAGLAEPPGTAQEPPGPPRSQAEAMRVIIGLSNSLDNALAYGRAQYRAGFADGARQSAGYCEHHHEQIADAIAEGQRLAHADGLDDYHAGWQACWRRFAAEIGSRVQPRTRRAYRPACGDRDCRRENCRPRRRKRQPWDQAAMIERARASWEPRP